MTLAVARLALVGYLLYGFGYIVPLLRRDFGIAESVAGLHASAIAAGIIVSGVAGERFVRRVGPVVAGRVAVVGLSAVSLAVAFAPHVIASLLAGFLLGAGAGVLLSWVNVWLTALGGQRASVALARANVVALVAAVAAPLAIATIDDAGMGGRFALLIPVFVVGPIEAAHWRGRDVGPIDAGAPRPPAASGDRLPREYWRAWFVLVMVIAIEFTIVFWGSSLIADRTGIGTAGATSAAAGFLVGMIVGRSTLAMGIGTRTSRVRLMTAALVLVIAGVAGAWQATTLPLSAVSLFVAGLGVGPLYPVGVAFALGLVREAPEAAAARATLASGVAILIAPFVLAVTAERIGLVSAWPLVGVIAIAAIAMLVVKRPPSLS